MPDDTETAHQKTAHDLYLLRFVVDDLWRDYNSAGREVLWLNWEQLRKLTDRLNALCERIIGNGSGPDPAEGRDCAAGE